jgi:hypothetical protein
LSSSDGLFFNSDAAGMFDFSDDFGLRGSNFGFFNPVAAARLAALRRAGLLNVNLGLNEFGGLI